MFEDLLTNNDVWKRRTQGVGVLTKEQAIESGCVGPIARATGLPYDVRRTFPYLNYPTYDFDVPTQQNGDVYARYLVRVQEMRESVKIARQALDRITPQGEWAVADPRIVPPPKDKVYTEMEALIQHFLIHSQGFTVPAGEAYVPIEGPRGEHGFYVRVGRQQPPVAHQVAAAVLPRHPGAAQDDRGRAHRRRDRGHRLDRRRHGRLRPMSFHPRMPYGEGWHKSDRQLPDEGPPFAYTDENRAPLRGHRRALPAGAAQVGDPRRALHRAGAAGLRLAQRRSSTSPR